MTGVDTSAIAQALLAISDIGRQVLDACDGYRAEATERGYPSAVVDSMVADYHRALMAMVLGPRPPA